MMSQGFQTFLEDGETVDVDITNRLPRYFGSVSIPASQKTGIIYNSYIDKNTDVWWFLMNAETNFSAVQASEVTYEYPTIEKGEGYLKWTFPSGRNLSCVMLYGAY